MFLCGCPFWLLAFDFLIIRWFYFLLLILAVPVGWLLLCFSVVVDL